VLTNLLSARAPWPGYIFGNTGVGKTCAGLCVFDHYRSMMVDASELADICWVPQDESYLWRHAQEEPLVIVDEVGASKNDREYQGLKRLADMRVNKPILWLSNLSPQGLREAFDERIFSRLCCGTVVEVQGPDQRFSR